MRQGGRVVADEPVDAEPKQRARVLGAIHRPGHDHVRDLAQGGDAGLIDQAFVNRNTVEPLVGEAAKHLPELPRASHRVHAADRGTGEALEQHPAARTHCEPSLAEVGLDRVEDVCGQPDSRALQVHYELRLSGGRCQQGMQLELGPPPRAKLPAIPEEGNRAGCLQVSDLEPAPVQADVSFYKGRSELFCRPEIAEAIPRAVCDEERPSAREVGRVRPERRPIHRPRV